MKVKGRSENVIRLCREVEYRLPKHPLFDNFRRGLRYLQKQAKQKLVVTVVNDLPQEKRYVSYRQLLSQMLGYEVASCVLRTNIYLNYNPTLDFRVTFPSGDSFLYSRDKRQLLERYMPDRVETESFGDAVQHLWKKYEASDDFYPLLCTLLSLKSPAPGITVEILSPNGIENVTLLFPLGNEVAAGASYWKSFLEESIKADKIQQASSQTQASDQLQSSAQAQASEQAQSSSTKSASDLQNSTVTQGSTSSHASATGQSLPCTQSETQSQTQAQTSISAKEPTSGTQNTPQTPSEKGGQTHNNTPVQKSGQSKESGDVQIPMGKRTPTHQTSVTTSSTETSDKSQTTTATPASPTSSKTQGKGKSKKSVAKGVKTPSVKSDERVSSEESQKQPVAYADPEVAKAKFINALDEANAFLVLTSIDELLSHNFLGLLGHAHPALSKNTIVVLEGDSHGLPGQQLNDLLTTSLGTSSPLWMYFRSGDVESFASELRSFVKDSTRKMEETYITGMACTLLEVAAKDLKKMIDLLTQEKTTALEDSITPLDDYFYYYFSQARLNDLIRKRTQEFKENFPNDKANLLDYVSERINACITSDELMSILEDHEVRKLCEYQYIISHQFYLDRQHKLLGNFNLQLARLYSEFEANYHVDPLELELQFEKEDPIYRYKVSFDIFERLLNVLMKSTSDLEQAKAHMMNSVLAKFQEDYIELENYYVYHFRKSMLLMEEGVEKIRKEYHKFYKESIDRKSDAFIRRINKLQSQLSSINDTLDMLRHSPIPESGIG